MSVLIVIVGILTYRAIFIDASRERIIEGGALLDTLTGSFIAAPGGLLGWATATLHSSPIILVAALLCILGIATPARTLTERVIFGVALLASSAGSLVIASWIVLTRLMLAPFHPAIRVIIAGELLLFSAPLASLSFATGLILAPKNRIWWLTAFCISYLVALGTTPPPFPDIRGSIIPDDGFPGIIRPLLGSDHPLPTLLADPYGPTLAFVALLLVIVLLFSHRAFIRTSAGMLVVALAGALVVDYLAPIELRLVFPVEALARVIPGLGLYSIESLFIPLSMLVLSASRLPFRSSALSALVVAVFMPLTSLERLPANQPWTMYLMNNYIREDVIMRSRRALFTVPLPKDCEITSSRGKVDRSLLTDQNPQTRVGLPQTEAHWISIQCSTPLRIRAIHLDVGDYKTDFPRGISLATACNAEAPAFYSIDHWLGPVRWSGDGFPSFGSQADVRIVLPRTTTSTCFTIHETAQAPFDWSIAELRVLR